LVGINDRLRGEWGEKDGMSVRELTDWYNKRVLKSVFNDQNKMLLDGEVDLIYDLLTSEEASAGMKVQTRHRLKKHDINDEKILSDFISRQTLYRHLNNCLSLSYSPPSDDIDPSQKFRNKISQLEGRVAIVSKDGLKQLRNKGTLHIEDPEIIVNISVLCKECNYMTTATDLFENDTCDCHETP
jgi:hypothetical protein